MHNVEEWILYVIGCSALAFVAKTLAEIARAREAETWFQWAVRWCMFCGALMVWVPGAGAALMLGIRLLWGE